MGGEGIQRHVGDDTQLREASLEGTGGPLGQPIRVVGLFRQQTLLRQRRHREQGDGGYAEGHQLFGFRQQQIDG